MSCSEQYKDLCDEQLVTLVYGGDTEAFVVLLNRYQRVLFKKAQSFSKTLSDVDDYHQEALISFYNAVKTFSEDKASFKTYFTACVNNSLITLQRKLNKAKENEKTGNDDNISVVNDPLSLLENQESDDDFNNKIRNLLSDFEWQTLELYLSGNTYEQIAKKLNSTLKSVDNALQRVRQKLKLLGKPN